jgi:hypothetical protein
VFHFKDRLPRQWQSFTLSYTRPQE